MTERALVIAADHPAFAGHFPGTPILPAVVLIAEALAAVEEDTRSTAVEWSLAQAKFARAVTPGTPLALACEDRGESGVRFEIRSPQGVVASGAFVRAGAAR